jgi:fatty acid kinase fatty acid binding subunit
MAVRIVTDSACDLPQDLCDEYGIEIVPLHIRFGATEYVDRVELSTDEFWQKLGQSSVLPETAAPSVGAFEETFRRLGDEGAEAIVCINLSAGMSATMQSAKVASKALDGICPVEVLDSGTVSMGQGDLVLQAARRAKEGAALEAIVAETEHRRARSRLLAALDTLEYLRKGGRVGAAQALLGSVLSIKPVITVEGGIVHAAGKVRTRSKALRFMSDQLQPGSVESACVLHANAPDVDEFLSQLERSVPRTDIVVAQIGPVVGVHVGPRAMGVVWVERTA